MLVGRLTPVVRSFVSIPAGIFEAPLPRYTVLTLIGSAVWCFVFAGIGWAAGASWESFHERVPLRGRRRRADRRRRRRVARLAVPAQAAGCRARPERRHPRGPCRPARTFSLHSLPPGTLGRRDSARRRQGAVRAADPRAQGALRRGARVGPLHLRARGRGVRAGVGRLSRRPARDRRRQRHGCARPLARGDGHRRRRRGDLPVVHVLRDLGGDRPRRRHPGLRRHRSRQPQSRPGRRGRADHAADEGDHARPPLRPPRAARRARGPRAAADRGRRAGVRCRRRRERGRLLHVQLLPDEEPLRARRRRARRLPRRRGGRARPDAALPRLARQADLRARRHQLAARRDPRRRAARLPAPARAAGTRAAARVPRATRSSGSATSSSSRSTSRATSTTCTSSARRIAPGSPPR